MLPPTVPKRKRLGPRATRSRVGHGLARVRRAPGRLRGLPLGPRHLRAGRRSEQRVRGQGQAQARPGGSARVGLSRRARPCRSNPRDPVRTEPSTDPRAGAAIPSGGQSGLIGLLSSTAGQAAPRRPVPTSPRAATWEAGGTRLGHLGMGDQNEALRLA